MVIFDLICDSLHEFEGWFRNYDELSHQQENGLLTCPICNSGQVNKKVSIPKVGKKSNSTQKNTSSDFSLSSESAVDSAVVGSKEVYSQLQGMLKKVHDYVENNFEDVGNKFAEEAICMHKGEKESANIRGTVNADQLKELKEEGVTAVPLPDKPIDKDKLN